MEKVKTFLAAMLVALLCVVVGHNTANAQSATGAYSVTVNTPGTFGQVMLQNIDNWSDVVELTVSGHLNEADMEYFSRMQNMTKLDVSNTDITSIGGCKELTNLTTVVLPTTVKAINDNAFNSCSALSQINLDNIESIGSNSFSECISLSGALNLEKLIILGSSAFKGCKELTYIEMPIVEEIGDGAFSMNNSYYDKCKIISVIMPNVRSIGSAAFSYCANLESINIPNCTYLGGGISDYSGHCFSGCEKLTSITLSDDLEVIPYYSFNSTGIENIKLPKRLKGIGRGAFSNSNLTNISIPEGVTLIKESAFNCPLESIVLPSTIENIERDAFYYCDERYNNGKYEYIYVLKDVYCNAVVPIVTDVFNNDMAKGATLHVPAFSVSAYKLDDNWYKFNKIEAIDGDLSDVLINNTFTIVDYAGLADEANLTLTSVSSESSSSSTAGHLTVSGGSSLTLNRFVQIQNWESKEDGYYDENGNYAYRYNYPYCTTLIANNEVKANNVTTKIQLPTKQWSFISFPYEVNVNDIVVPEGVMWVVRKYNGSNRASMAGDTWENVGTGETLNAGEGYILHCVDGDTDSWSTNYIEFEFPAVANSNLNKIFAYDDVAITLKEYPAEFSHNRGWNLVGNPYPCYYNSQNIDFSAPITVWNGNGYTAYSLVDDEYLMRPNEAFFVQCPINTNQLQFTAEGRTHSYMSSSIPSNMRVKAQAFESRGILNFLLTGAEYSDKARLVLNESALAEYEIERDASKFMSSNAEVPQIYIIDNGVNYAINERPLGSGVYSLGVKIGKEGSYKLALNSKNADCDVALIDKLTNETVNLNVDAYSFDSDAQTYADRFVVTITPKSSSIIDAASKTPGFSINGNCLSVVGDEPISIYSIDGKLVFTGIADQSIELNTGIYLLSISDKTHKIAIK